MQNIGLNQYQPSGLFSLKVYIILLLFGLTVLPVLGVLYSTLTWFVPVIYFNFIITAAFGSILGVMVYPVIRLGHVRSWKIELLAMAIIVFLSWYYSWAAYLVLWYNASGDPGLITASSFTIVDFLNYVFNPFAMLQDIAVLYEYGSWSIGSVVINQEALIATWVMELAIILAVAWKVNKKWSEFPYSEYDLKWYRKVTLKERITLIRGVSKIIKEIGQNELSELKSKPLLGDYSREYTELVLYVSDTDRTAYVVFYNQALSRGSSGEPKTRYYRNSGFIKLGEELKKELMDTFKIRDKHGLKGNLQLPFLDVIRSMATALFR
ncbi:hypothetical protein FNH22_04425 [Fulvivirga sp. M361]|uniref:hypothetical protein n=1 Tax=Fulvivirga sp. M361 TaxID=2594266 RepID=UPI001179F78D|nr:hypothetical protein [Fulvivirga sp. M361]TRX61306.1 hypothetical protein FNH22_04425 [Fulvivirga sp. M361]